MGFIATLYSRILFSRFRCDFLPNNQSNFFFYHINMFPFGDYMFLVERDISKEMDWTLRSVRYNSDGRILEGRLQKRLYAVPSKTINALTAIPEAAVAEETPTC
jgi:hypothetical protein